MSNANYDAARAAWRSAKLTPLWESRTAHKHQEAPRGHHWQWSQVRPLLQSAMELSSPEVVERRVLSLMNPFSDIPDDDMTIGNLAVALQMLMPGETARPHRHSMNALRFILEGRGAETLVNGKVCQMEPGDLVLTPAWCWHEHRHPGHEPMVWLDVLDVPLHLHLGTTAFEPGPIKITPETFPEDAFAMPNIVPEAIPTGIPHSPVFSYPYRNAVAAVQAAPRGPDGTRRVRYVNPINGSSAIPFIDSALMQIDRGTDTLPTKSSASSTFCVAEGEGETTIGNDVFSWKQKDIFTLPPGVWARHRSTSDTSRLLHLSDRDVLSRLGLLREQVGNGA